MQFGVGVVDPTELGSGGVPDQDGAGAPETGDLGGVVVGDPVFEDHRGFRKWPPVDGLEFLHPDGDTAEGQRDVGMGGARSSGVGIEMGEGVEGRSVDGGQRRLQGLDGCDFAGAEGVDERAGIPLPGLIVHGG